MTAAAAALLLLVRQIPGAVEIDPRLRWYTVETEHFSVHFSERSAVKREELDLPLEIARICEEVHSTITPVIGWTPAGRTQVVIADFFDYSNGWAAPFPDNTITIIPTLPAGDRTGCDNWLRTLITHEYTHILQMDMARGVPRFLRNIFGRIALPNALMPAWMLEGYAVLSETWFTSFGRGRSAEYDMIARTIARARKTPRLGRCATWDLRAYPGGTAPYLFGSLLHKGLSPNPASPWSDYNRLHSMSLPFLENLQARRVFGAGFNRLWNGIRETLFIHAETVAARVSAAGKTPLRRITAEGYNTASPCWSRTGDALFYQGLTAREYPGIKTVELGTRRTRTIHRGRVTGTMDLSPDGRLLAFSEFTLQDNAYEFTDIFAIDLVTGSVRRLTRGLRARDPDFAPDTSLLVFVSNRGGHNDLNLLDLETGQVTAMTETDDYTGYHSPRFSPSGKLIAVGVNRPGGFADIDIIDRSTGWTVTVTHDRATDISPCWSSTGRFLLFASDRTGIYNIYAYEVATARLRRCTNVTSGAFQPAVSPDNRLLALVSNTAEGDDVFTTGYDASLWTDAGQLSDTLPVIDVSQGLVSRLIYYNPFPTILPKFWLPWLATSPSLTWGAMTMGWDALQLHRYSFFAGYRPRDTTPTPTAAIGYGFQGILPHISAAADLDLHRQQAELSLELPLRAIRRSHRLTLFADATRDSAVHTDYTLSWTYSDAVTYRFGVAPSEGMTAGAAALAETPKLASANERLRLLGLCTYYLGAPPAPWSLRARLAYGTALGDTSAGESYRIQAEPGILAVRGYDTATALARTVLVAGLQFRTPLWWIEQPIISAALFLQNINAAAFSDFGLLTNSHLPDAAGLDSARVGVGAELRTDWIIGYVLPASAGAGVALGIKPWYSYRLYLGIESGLLSELLIRPGRSGRPFSRLPDQN